MLEGLQPHGPPFHTPDPSTINILLYASTPTSLLCTVHNLPPPPPPHPFSQKNPDQGPHAECIAYRKKNVGPLVRLPAQRQELPA